MPSGLSVPKHQPSCFLSLCVCVCVCVFKLTLFDILISVKLKFMNYEHLLLYFRLLVLLFFIHYFLSLLLLFFFFFFDGVGFIFYFAFNFAKRGHIPIIKMYDLGHFVAHLSTECSCELF